MYDCLCLEGTFFFLFFFLTLKNCSQLFRLIASASFIITEYIKKYSGLVFNLDFMTCTSYRFPPPLSLISFSINFFFSFYKLYQLRLWNWFKTSDHYCNTFITGPRLQVSHFCKVNQFFLKSIICWLVCQCNRYMTKKNSSGSVCIICQSYTDKILC